MRRLRLSSSHGDDPLDGMANLFDLGVVFALGFGIAILARVTAGDPQRARQLMQTTATAASERIPDTTTELERFRHSDESLGGNGTRLGTAYRLANGEVVYVPEEPTH